MIRLFELFVNADGGAQGAVLLMLGCLIAGIGLTVFGVTWLIVSHQ